jgi:MFS family permease
LNKSHDPLQNDASADKAKNVAVGNSTGGFDIYGTAMSEKKIISLFFLMTIFLSYISLGLPDSIWGVVWPNARADFGAPQEFAGYYSMTVTFCCMLSALFSLRLAKHFGAGKIAAVSCLLTGGAIFFGGFVGDKYLFFIVAVVMGFGSGAVDAVLNEYIANHYSSKIMNWLHASWGVGAMISPLILTVWINRGNWRGGFFTIGAIQTALAVLFFSTLFLWKRKHGIKGENVESITPYAPELTMKNLAPWLCVLIFFLYVGAEGAVGVWLKTLLYDTRGIDNTKAGIAVSLYYASIMAGRVGVGFFSKKIGNRNAIRFGLALALIGALSLGINNYYLNLLSVFLIGAGFAPVYPSMMHETTRRFSKETASKTIGFQMAGASAGAMLCVPAVGFIGAASTMEILTIFAAVAAIAMFAASEAVNRMTLKRKER